jgi:hypothetical protein
MDVHGLDVSVLEPCCGALYNLLNNAREADKTAFATDGCMQLVYRSLRSHVYSAGLCVAGLALLATLAVSSGARVSLAAGGAIALVTSAMDAHATDAAVVERALGVLRNLTRNIEVQVRCPARSRCPAMCDCDGMCV